MSSIGRPERPVLAPDSQVLAAASFEPIKASSERNRRTNSAPNSHSFLSSSRLYAPLAMRDTVEGLRPKMCAKLAWVMSKSAEALSTAVVKTRLGSESAWTWARGMQFI